MKEELKNDCAKYGEVQKVVIYEVTYIHYFCYYLLCFILLFIFKNSDDGIATVTFKTPEDADDCITMMDYRIFHGKQIRAETWDGKTKYKSDESKEDQDKRLSSWHEFLDAAESSSTNDHKPH